MYLIRGQHNLDLFNYKSEKISKITGGINLPFDIKFPS